MKAFLLLLCLALFSCQPYQSPDTSYLDELPAVEETVVTDTVQIKPEPTTKYGFIVMVVDHKSMSRKRYTTDVVEINVPVTEDYKYKELDLAERNLRDAEYYPYDDIEFESRDMYIFDTLQTSEYRKTNNN